MKHWITNELQDAAIRDLQTLVSYPSVCHEEERMQGAPFGKDIVDCLDKTLELFEAQGFSTYKDPDGYYGYAEIGESEEIFAVLCHLDVVPAGDLNDWDTPPFEAVLTDDGTKIVGRGVQDDKGPTIAALYALKSVIEKMGQTPKKKVRFIFGTDEETLWRCMDEYNKKEQKAEMGFAPDADFPLIYAEKGLLQAKAMGPGADDFSLEAGSALNVVPDKATYKGSKAKDIAEELARLNYSYQLIDDCTVQTYGESVHSKDAADGVNAIIHLAEAMLPFYHHPMIHFLGNVVKNDGTGANVLGYVEDEASGCLSFNCATLTIDSQHSELGLDLRIPVTIDTERLITQLIQKLEDSHLVYEQVDYVAPLYVPKDSMLINTLMQVYQDMTGDITTQPMVSGGATFARTMDHCVAFGAMFPNTETTEHQPNECWDLQDMRRAMDIYAEAFSRLVF